MRAVIQRVTSAVSLEPSNYLSDYHEISNRYKHTNYPIVNSDGTCEGMLRAIDTADYTKQRVILVDHNEPIQSVDGLNEAEILEIVDHHNIGSIFTNNPINFRNMSVGSVNTIIYDMYKEAGIKIPKDIAGIMLSGIISDTLLLASPTTTPMDERAATALAKTASVDMKAYGLALLQSGVSIKGLTPGEVIYKDLKTYVVGESNIAIGQVFTTDFKEYQKQIQKYVKNLNELSAAKDYKVVALFVTDIINNDSYLIYNDDAHKYLESAFNIDNLDQGHMLRGVISRKTQMLPPIISVLEK